MVCEWKAESTRMEREERACLLLVVAPGEVVLVLLDVLDDRLEQVLGSGRRPGRGLKTDQIIAKRKEAWIVSRTLGSQGGNGRARGGRRRRRGTHEHVDDLQQTRDGLVVRHGRKVVDSLPSRKGHVAAEERRVVASGEGCVLPSSKSSVPRRGRVSGEGSVEVDRVEGRVEAQVGRGVVDRRLVKQGRVSRGLRVGCRWSREGGLVSWEWLREERGGGQLERGSLQRGSR